MRTPSVILLGLAFCLVGVQSLQQQEETADRITAVTTCVGTNVIFPWGFNSISRETMPQETLTMKWLHEGVIMATCNADHQIHLVNPLYAQRLQMAEVGGRVTLTEVTLQDSGNYALVVSVFNDRGLITSYANHSLLLTVGGLTSSDGDLHVEMGSNALWDKDSSQWMIRISCGPFSFPAQPGFDVIWITPGGEKLNSSVYDQGNFHLHLFSPVPGGRYTCRVPPQRFADACVGPGGGSQGDGKLEDTVRVDDLKARLLMLEADLKVVKDENRSLKQTQTLLEERSTELEEKSRQQTNKSRQLEAKSRQLEEKSTRLEEKSRQLEEKSTQLEEKSRQLEEKSTQLEEKSRQLEEKSTQLGQDVRELRMADQQMREDVGRNLSGPLAQLRERIDHMSTNIAFMTQFKGQKVLRRVSRIKLATVLYNQGNGYQASTGEFTAPISGTYYFFMKTESMINREVKLDMKVEGLRVLYLHAHDRSAYQTTSGGVVVHLDRGQRVWVDTEGVTSYVRDWTRFGGFLVHPDATG